MPIIADTHIHLYSCYAPGRFFRLALRRLGELARRWGGPDAARVLCLVDRAGSAVFEELRSGRFSGALEGVRVIPTADPAALAIEVADEAKGWLLAGRQIVTRERLEALALCTPEAIPDGLVLDETFDRIHAAGGFPVLPWAPGKWFFARGQIVRRAFERAEPGELALGDTSLRPVGWGEPALMRQAQRRGLALLAGSDPLPFPGEEDRAGTYATWCEADLDSERPAASFRERVENPKTRFESVGRRGAPWSVARRLWQNSRVRT